MGILPNLFNPNFAESGNGGVQFLEPIHSAFGMRGSKTRKRVVGCLERQIDLPPRMPCDKCTVPFQERGFAPDQGIGFDWPGLAAPCLCASCISGKIAGDLRIFIGATFWQTYV